MRKLSAVRAIGSLLITLLGFCGCATPTPPPASPPQPQAAGHWTNSLGMVFTPVPNTSVLFCVWETRVQDFATFVAATRYQTGRGMYVAGTNDWHFRADCNWQQPGFAQTDTHPVVGVNWHDAHAFCRWLTKREQQTGWLTPTQHYRLPTDAEWSTAVGLRSETGRTPQEKFLRVRGIYPWGTNWPPAAMTGNFAPALGVDPFERTAPVGSFPPNEYDLFDLAGNVAEWCEDKWNDKKPFRVLRGSPWNNDCPTCLQSSYRFPNQPEVRNDYYGFRIVLSLQP